MRMRYLAAVAALVAPIAASGPAQAAPDDLSWKCGDITIKYTFDNDQTGGWWVVTTSMDCTPRLWPKRYSLEISDRPFSKYYLFDHTGYTSPAYNKTIIIDATPAKANKSACIEARAELYFPNKDEATEKSRNACFKTAAP